MVECVEEKGWEKEDLLLLMFFFLVFGIFSSCREGDEVRCAGGVSGDVRESYFIRIEML